MTISPTLEIILTGETIYNIKVKARPTIGNCRCLHPELPWHVGLGRFVDYVPPHTFLHQWTYGLPMFSLYKSILDTAASVGETCSLVYPDLRKAVTGFFRKLRFDKKAFTCPIDGTSPPYFTGDGKEDIGPLKRNGPGVEEFDRAPDDTTLLSQGSKFKERVFLSVYKERNLVTQLLTGKIDMNEFVSSGTLTSISTNTKRNYVPLKNTILIHRIESSSMPLLMFVPKA